MVGVESVVSARWKKVAAKHLQSTWKWTVL